MKHAWTQSPAPTLVSAAAWLTSLALASGAFAQSVPVPADSLKKLVLRAVFSGALEESAVADAVEADVSGPLSVARVDSTTGDVAAEPGAAVGSFGPLRIRWMPGLTEEREPAIFLNDPQITMRFTFESLAIMLTDGSVLAPIPEIPMEGRLVIEYGPVAADGETVQVRAVGCGGVAETAGRGLLAGGRGAICLNGFMRFRQPAGAPLAFPLSAETFAGFLRDLVASGRGAVSGESVVTITTHVVLASP